MQNELERRQTDLASLEAKITVKSEILDRLETKIEAMQKTNELQESEITTRRSAAELELKKLLAKAENAVKIYRETQAKTDAINTEMATRVLALEKREEVISRKEHALKDAESQVAELHRFMKM